MKLSSKNIHFREVAANRIAELREQAEQLGYPDIDPEIQFSLDGVNAGMAIGSHRIELHEGMMEENFDHYVEQTIGHEFIHCLDYKMRDGTGHDDVWKQLMVEFGLEPKTYHSYDIRKIRLAKGWVEYACDCPEPFVISAKRHRKILNGHAYSCGDCNTQIRELKANLNLDVPKELKSSTKKDIAMWIYQKHSKRGMNRRQIIDSFKMMLDMGDAGAATYYHMCKKAYE